MIGVAFGGDREDAVRRDGIPFQLVCEDASVNDEEREGFYLDIPWFREGRTGIDVGSCSVSGGKVEFHVRVVSINQGCTGG